MGIQLLIFGRNGCARCETTKHKLGHFLKRWALERKVEMVFHDMETDDGCAEGMFRDVLNVPTTVVCEGSRAIARWDGVVPNSEEVKACLEGMNHASAG